MKNKIIDCITFFDNNLMFNLRYNILNEFVDYFVICESKFDHQGNKKEINFKELISFCNSHIISKDENILIIEGVGGTMVPINNKFTILDLMKRLDIPIILTIG